MYNLLYYQIVVQLCTTLSESECDQIITKYVNEPAIIGAGFGHLGAAMAFVLINTDKCKHMRPESVTPSVVANDDPFTAASLNLNLLEQQLQKLCLPFLRVAALIRHHIYEQELPEIKTPQVEFVRLMYFTELVTESSDWESFNAANGLTCIPGVECSLPKYWCDQLMEMRPMTTNDQIEQAKASTTLVSNQHALWQQPRLLGLPREYERLFTVGK